MYSRWNDEGLKKHFHRTLKHAKEDIWKFTDSELDTLYLNDLYHQTGSVRIRRMITLAYHLGKLKGIQEVDEGKTPIVLR